MIPGPAGPRGLYAAKAWYTDRLGGFITLAVRSRISPNVFTWVGIGGGLAAAALLAHSAAHPHPLWAVAVALALAIRLAGANLSRCSSASTASRTPGPGCPGSVACSTGSTAC